MQILNCDFMQSAIRMALDAWRKGWHEHNGGNFSYRIRPEELLLIESGLRVRGEWLALPWPIAELAGESFLITGKGKCMRNMGLAPQDGMGIIRLDEYGAHWQLIWGLEADGLPTSELPSHLLNQAVKKVRGQQRVIYHSHPENTIALSFVLPLDSAVFTRELWSMMPECVMMFPEGIGLLPWMMPGSQEIAQATAQLMQEHNVVLWAQHGVFCAGTDFDATLGLMETVEKAASILVKVLAMGGKEQGPGKSSIRKLAAGLNLPLNEKMLG